MAETPREPDLAPGERIEHHEVTERVTPGVEPGVPRRGSPMWAWVLPLVILALVLVWYVLSRGEPASPVDAIEDIGMRLSDVGSAPLAVHDLAARLPGGLVT